MSKRGLLNRVEDLENRSPHGSGESCRRWIAATLDPPLSIGDPGPSLEEAATHCPDCRAAVEKLNEPFIWEEELDG